MGFLISVPLVFSLLLFATKDYAAWNKKIALAASLVTFVISVGILLQYLANPSGYPAFIRIFSARWVLNSALDSTV